MRNKIVRMLEDLIEVSYKVTLSKEEVTVYFYNGNHAHFNLSQNTLQSTLAQALKWANEQSEELNG